MEEKLRKLKLKKVQLVDQMSMLSSISDHFYTQLGKLEAEILKEEKEIVRQTKNTLDEN
ncbi:MAG: hypothetical protein J0M25_00630 [Flavobacteriales bacterium]|nr:hypothetical protein [Flavobacteriales bacterium]